MATSAQELLDFLKANSHHGEALSSAQVLQLEADFRSIVDGPQFPPYHQRRLFNWSK